MPTRRRPGRGRKRPNDRCARPKPRSNEPENWRKPAARPPNRQGKEPKPRGPDCRSAGKSRPHPAVKASARRFAPKNPLPRHRGPRRSNERRSVASRRRQNPRQFPPPQPGGRLHRRRFAHPGARSKRNRSPKGNRSPNGSRLPNRRGESYPNRPPYRSELCHANDRPRLSPWRHRSARLGRSVRLPQSLRQRRSPRRQRNRTMCRSARPWRRRVQPPWNVPVAPRQNSLSMLRDKVLDEPGK
jgi:hypothetical protein